MKWFKWPKKDETYQWWWGYRKVRINVLSEEEKQKYLEKVR